MNIVITGAGKGIGFETAVVLAQEGHGVVAVSRDVSSLEALNNPNLHPVSFDLTRKDFTPLKEVVLSHFKTVNVVVNNAGLLINKPFNALTDDDFDRLFDVNVKAAFKLTQNLLSLMPEGAHVVNISSMGGYQGSVKFPGLSLYSAAKGALAVMTESWAVEFQTWGIRVNALALGAVQTEMLLQAFPDYQAPLQPEEMARFIADFALTGNRYFNGKILPVSLSTP